MDSADKKYIKDNCNNSTINNMFEHFGGKYTKTQIKNFCTNNHLAYKSLNKTERGKIIADRNKKMDYNRTQINKDYFKIWTKNMAYVFGLWCADGCISNTSGGYYFSIKLKQSDKYLLKDILTDMESEHKIYNKSDGSCEINFSCKEIYNDIISIGGMENKSLILKLPHIPNEYVSHFIRGYFDGDGSLNNRHTGYLIGTFEFCNSVKDILNNNGIEISSIKQKHPENGVDNNCYCLNIFKQNEFKKFEEFMYKDVDEHTLYLKRKDARNFYDI